MNSVGSTIIVIVLIIFLGFISKKFGLVKESDVGSFNNIVIYLFMPCMIFHAVYSSDLSILPQLSLLPFIIILGSLILGFISYFIFNFLNFKKKKLWSILVTLMISNTGFMGYPIAFGILGNEGLVRAIFCDLGTSCIFLALSFILILTFGGNFKDAIKGIVKFPPLWGLILGILFNLWNIPINDILENTIVYLGQGTIPLIMVSLGISLKFEGFLHNKKIIALTSVLKLLVLPFIVFLIVSLIGLRDINFIVPIFESAMPSGMLGLVLSIKYGLDYRLTSDCIFSNTIISLITLPIIISLL